MHLFIPFDKDVSELCQNAARVSQGQYWITTFLDTETLTLKHGFCPTSQACSFFFLCGKNKNWSIIARRPIKA